jgi:hypothetical protein
LLRLRQLDEDKDAYCAWKTDGTGDDPKTEGGAPGAPAGSDWSGCATGPSITGAGEGDGNGEGIGFGKASRMGLGKFSPGFDCGWVEIPGFILRTCAVATVTGATARKRIARALVSDRMMSRPIAVSPVMW